MLELPKEIFAERTKGGLSEEFRYEFMAFDVVDFVVFHCTPTGDDTTWKQGDVFFWKGARIICNQTIARCKKQVKKGESESSPVKVRPHLHANTNEAGRGEAYANICLDCNTRQNVVVCRVSE